MTWRDRAACSGMDLSLFYDGRSNDAAAKAVCRSCPVQTDCLTGALEVPSMNDYGIHGGTTAEERKALRRQAKDRPDEPAPMTADERAIVVGLLGLLEHIRVLRSTPAPPEPDPTPVLVHGGRCRRRTAREHTR